MNYLEEQVDHLPSLPGCYIFRDVKDTIIYIGKSKSLKNRVKQYFTAPDSKKGKLVFLVREIDHMEHIVTKTELDALLLECKLIKQYQPKYNTQLKKSRRYAYIQITQKDTYPAISVTKERDEDNKNFGYFYNEKEAFETILLLNSIWKTPVCNKSQFSGNSRTCLNFHLGKCCGPCGKSITEEDYRSIIQEVVKCLKGNSQSIIRFMKKEMEQAAIEMDFEKAALIRNKIKGLCKLKKKSKRCLDIFGKQDVYVFLRPFYQSSVAIFFIREKIVLHRIDFENVEQIDEDSIIGFLKEIQNEHFSISENEYLTNSIQEIFCDRHFIPVFRKNSIETMAKRIKKESLQLREKPFENA